MIILISIITLNTKQLLKEHCMMPILPELKNT